MKYTIMQILFICGCIICLALTGCGADRSADIIDIQAEGPSDTKDEKDTEDAEDKAEEQTQSVVAVYVCGHVNRPGVYELASGSRVCDAIEAAGGVKEKADAEIINQAETVSDGMRLYIPSRDEASNIDRMSQGAGGRSSGSVPPAVNSQDSGLVNINQADREELMQLSGIGESKADSIIRYREENGPFSKIEEIMNIRGIKEGVFDQIKDSITV